MMTSCARHKDCILEYAVKGSGLEFANVTRKRGKESCDERYIENEPLAAGVGEKGLGEEFMPCRTTLDGVLKDGKHEGCWIQYYVREEKTDEFNQKTGVMKMDVRWEKFSVEHHCPFQIEPAMVLGIVGGAVLLLGLLLLALWKILMMYLDWREYKTFEDEFKKLKHWKEDNPLYVPAEETTQNPLLQKKK